MDELKPTWEVYGDIINGLARIKVDGGWLYAEKCERGPMCFVPDVDLTRYQAHLRDAYKAGYEAGLDEAKHDALKACL